MKILERKMVLRIEAVNRNRNPVYTYTPGKIYYVYNLHTVHIYIIHYT